MSAAWLLRPARLVRRGNRDTPFGVGAEHGGARFTCETTIEEERVGPVSILSVGQPGETTVLVVTPEDAVRIHSALQAAKATMPDQPARAVEKLMGALLPMIPSLNPVAGRISR